MFDPTSRYHELENAVIDVAQPDGTIGPVAYKRRRFLPLPRGMSTIAQHTVREGDRLDNITASYLRDPLQFWRVCDANLTFHPDDLLVPGQVVIIALATR